jgi:hypothetical protein
MQDLSGAKNAQWPRYGVRGRGSQNSRLLRWVTWHAVVKRCGLQTRQGRGIDLRGGAALSVPDDNVIFGALTCGDTTPRLTFNEPAEATQCRLALQFASGDDSKIRNHKAANDSTITDRTLRAQNWVSEINEEPRQQILNPPEHVLPINFTTTNQLGY